VCVLLFVLLVGVFFLPSPRSQALRNNQQSETEPKRKISLGSTPPKEVSIIGIRHTEDDDWYNKVEFEIQNEAKSDIWFIQVRVLLPEYARNNSTPGFFLEFGKDSPLSGGIDRPNKPLIRPGERYVFRIPPDQVENIIKIYSTDRVTVPPVGRLRFELYKIYFTDGMNFIGGKRVIIGPDGSVMPIQISKFEGSSERSALKLAAFYPSRAFFSGSSFFLRKENRRPVESGGVWCEGTTGSPECGNNRLNVNGTSCDVQQVPEEI